MWTPKCTGCVIDHAKAAAMGVAEDLLPTVNDATVLLDGRSLAICHIQVVSDEEAAAMRRQAMEEQFAAAERAAQQQQRRGVPVTDEVARKLSRNGTRLHIG